MILAVVMSAAQFARGAAGMTASPQRAQKRAPLGWRGDRGRL